MKQKGEVGGQFLKFLVIGGCSFVIDAAIRWLLLFGIHSGSHTVSDLFGTWLKQNAPAVFGYADQPVKAAAPFAFLIASFISILFNFNFSRIWTFGIKGREERMRQFGRFLGVYAVGLIINTLVSTAVYAMLGGNAQRGALIATAVAAAVSAVWNFTGQRLYAFRKAER